MGGGRWLLAVSYWLLAVIFLHSFNNKEYIRNFRKYTVWKNGISLVKMIYKFSKKLPQEEKFGLIS